MIENTDNKSRGSLCDYRLKSVFCCYTKMHEAGNFISKGMLSSKDKYDTGIGLVKSLLDKGCHHTG